MLEKNKPDMQVFLPLPAKFMKVSETAFIYSIKTLREPYTQETRFETLFDCEITP